MNFVKTIAGLKKDPKAFILLFFSFVSILGIFITTESFLFYELKLIAPAPIVFSKKINHGASYSKYIFEFFSNENTFVEKHFNRNYYKNLKGPHRYKMFHFLALNKNSFLEPSANHEFYKSIFCQFKDVKNAFKIDFEIFKVKIKSNHRVLHEIRCFE